MSSQVKPVARTRAISDQVYTRLKGLIVSNRLKPGQRLTDRELAERLEVSRTPVRVALQRLEQDKLVSHLDGRGYVVAELDMKRIANLYDLREVLEGGAARLAAQRATSAQIEQIEKIALQEEQLAHDRSKRAVWLKLGLQLHEMIAQASGNSILAETLIRVLDHMRVFVWLEVLSEDAEMTEVNCREHSGLIELIKAHRADEAEDLMRSHIRTAKERILKAAVASEAFYDDDEDGWALGLEVKADGHG